MQDLLIKNLPLINLADEDEESVDEDSKEIEEDDDDEDDDKGKDKDELLVDDFGKDDGNY